MDILSQLEGCESEVEEDVHSPDDEMVTFSRDDDIPILENGDRHLELERVRMWQFKPMTKENSLGATLVWTIALDLDKHLIIVRHGHLSSDKIQTEEVEVELNTSGRNFEEQALVVMRNRSLKKYREGYRSDGDPPPMKGPMLANIYREGKTRLNFPVALTVKLDGIRCVIGLDGDGVKYRSKQNKVYPHLHPVFDKDIEVFYRYFPPYLELDGEMYSHSLTFNEISSVFRREKHTDHSLMREHIKYHLFDCNGDGVFEERFEKLLSAYKKYASDPDNTGSIVLVNCVWAQSPEEMDDYYRYVLEHGFEGLMIRKLGISHSAKESIYKPGQRCNNILKLKPIMDEEALVVGVVGASGREKDKALLKVKDVRGNVFLTRPAADFKLREKWFHNPELIIGKVVTIEFDSVSEKGVPRQPRSKGFRDYE